MRWASLSLAVFLVLMTAGQVLAQKRVALVIGNDSYVHQTPLENARRDAGLIGSELQKIGFKLVGDGPLLDLDKVTTDRMVETLAAQAQDSDVALFYFSGYGMQVGGTNYLLPVDLPGTSATTETVKFHALNLDLVAKILSSRARLTMILLDAKGPGGLAQMKAPATTIIGFAAQPNATAWQGPSGGVSPYAESLTAYLQVKNLGLFAMLDEVGLAVMRRANQKPWVSSTPIPGRVTLNPDPAKQLDLEALQRVRERLGMPSPAIIAGREPVPSNRAILATGYRHLPELGGEEEGYGLYSYAVLTSTSNRSSALLEEIFNSIPKIEDTAAHRSQLNILYLPTKKERLGDWEDSQRLNSAQFARKFSNSFYDYRMARSILNHICNPPADAVRNLCQRDMSRGPYIFTHAKPASALEPVPPPFLFVDLSDVHHRAFGEFAAAFREQVKREDISDGARINTLRLGILKITLKAGDLVVPIRKSIADIIHSPSPEKTRDR
jgi:Caspase domain